MGMLWAEIHGESNMWIIAQRLERYVDGRRCELAWLCVEGGGCLVFVKALKFGIEG